MPDRVFSSSDGRFGVRIGQRHLRRLLACCTTALPNETGGILVGHYTPAYDCGLVTSVSGPPGDSAAGRTWFQRGVQGLQGWLEKLWPKKDYYLGEWHFHPHAAAEPSETDISQLAAIAASAEYHCPEPLLLILGGDPRAAWHLRAFVVPRGHALIELPETPQG
jgi:integrative and conjugative element protein (TIGR02256 family)